MKRILILLIIGLFTFPLAISAQETNLNEIDGKTIDSIQFEGVIHADTDILDSVTEKYVGKPYSEDLFNQLKAELTSLQYFSYFYVYAGRTGDNNELLMLTFTVTELPYVTQVSFNGNSFFDDGDLNKKISIAAEGFYSKAIVNSDVKTLRNAYIDKGFVSCSIKSSITKNDEDNTIEVNFIIDEGKQSKINQLQFTGNEIYSSNSLKRVLTSKEQSLFNKGDYSEANILLDKDAIKKYYRKRGYVDCKITDVDVAVDTSDASKDLVTLTYVIDEGKQWKFGGLTTEGNTIFDDETLQKIITQHVGEPINIITMQQDIAKIADLYWNEGYIYNDIVPNEIRNEKEHSISYKLSITEKQQAYIEDIVIKGNKKTKDYVLYRELTIKVGDVFSKKKFIESVQNLYNTGIISNVDYDVLFGSADGLIVLEFIVEEANKVDLQFGATFGGTDEFPVSGFLSWTDKNFLGRGQDFSIATNVASSKQSLDFSYRDDWLAQRRWSGGIKFSVSHNNFDNILQDRTGYIFSDDDYYNNEAAPDPYSSYEEYQQAIEDGKRISEEFLMNYEQYKLSLGLTSGYTLHTDVGRLGANGGIFVGLTKVIYDDLLYRPYNPIIRNNLDSWKFSNKVNLSLNWDGRDLVKNPTKGFLFEDTVTYAGGFLGGSSQYIKNSLGASAYFTLFKLNNNELNPTNIILSAKSTVSHIFPQFFNYTDKFGLQDQPVATQSEKLYIDGMNIVRGIDSPIYNLEFLWDTSVDVSVPIVKNVLSGETYLSATGYKSSYEDSLSLGLTDFYFSTGAGVKLTIPGFPLGLYLTKVFSFGDDNQIVWQKGEIFHNADKPTSGFNLVLAITYSLY